MSRRNNIVEVRAAYEARMAALRLRDAFRLSAYTRRAVCKRYGLNHSELLDRRRTWNISQPRLMAMGMAIIAGAGLANTGDLWGVNHSSAYHAKRFVIDYIATNDNDTTQFLLDTIRGAKEFISR